MVETSDTKQQTNYNELIGIIDGEYYCLDYIFNGVFKGATGSIMRPVTPDEAQERRANYDFLELWQMAVADNRTEDSLAEWSEMVRNSDDDLFFDQSYGQYEDVIRTHFEANGEEAELVECIGGGRCFNTDMKWDELLRPDLWELIKAIES